MQLLARIYGACGVARVEKAQRLRARRDRGFELRGGDFVSVFRLGVYDDGLAAAKFYDFWIGDPIRCRYYDLIAFV